MTQNKVRPEDIFECCQCGDCCTGYGGTYVNEKDISRIAAFINTRPETFKKNYCQISDGKPVLKTGDNDKCIFFDPASQCTIHPVKPKMCKAWPFIENILRAPGNWNIMSDACPGIRTGFTQEQIKNCVKSEVEKLRIERKKLDE